MSRADLDINFDRSFIDMPVSFRESCRESAGNTPPVIMTIDCSKRQQDPLRATLHELVDDSAFDDTDLVLQRVARILRDERQKRSVA